MRGSGPTASCRPITPGTAASGGRGIDRMPHSAVALQEHAEVIAQIDPQAGRRFAREAKGYRKALRAAVEKSLTLSPVIRVRDGTYRSFLPTAPYIRGTASRFMPVQFGAHAFGMAMHTPGLYTDVVLSRAEVPLFGLLPIDDPRIQGFIDVLEGTGCSRKTSKSTWRSRTTIRNGIGSAARVGTTSAATNARPTFICSGMIQPPSSGPGSTSMRL